MQAIWTNTTLSFLPSSCSTSVNLYLCDVVSASLNDDNRAADSLPSHFALMNMGMIGFESGFESVCALAGLRVVLGLSLLLLIRRDDW